jgi:hypothetical protein
MQPHIVELAGLRINEFRQSYRGQVTHCHFVGTRVLQDFSTQVRTLDGAQVLLVRFSVTCVFVYHVGETRFNLGLDDLLPQPLSLDLLPSAA